MVLLALLSCRQPSSGSDDGVEASSQAGAEGGAGASPGAGAGSSRDTANSDARGAGATDPDPPDASDPNPNEEILVDIGAIQEDFHPAPSNTPHWVGVSTHIRAAIQAPSTTAATSQGPRTAGPSPVYIADAGVPH
jgi:hypothetical protein